MTSTEATQDITDAIAAGFDGFALNTHTISSTDTWNTDAINYLLDAASGTPFKMFLSFDMSWGLDVSSLGSFLTQFSNHSQYYTTSDGRPWVSTYSGGSSVSNDQWNSEFIQPLVAQGVTPYFVPDFDDWPGYPTGFFDAFPVLDGAFSWESAWPGAGTVAANVSDSMDESLIEQAHGAGKVYMMCTFPCHVSSNFCAIKLKGRKHCQPFSSNTSAQAPTGIASAKQTYQNASPKS